MTSILRNCLMRENDNFTLLFKKMIHKNDKNNTFEAYLHEIMELHEHSRHEFRQSNMTHITT